MYFVANFQHISDQQATDETERRHGSFSMMVESDSMDDALDKFRQRLVSFNESTTFFEGNCTIYITQLLELNSFPKNEAFIVNFKSFAGDPVMPFIACVVPTEQSNACSIHEWQKNRPITEGHEDSVFIKFN